MDSIPPITNARYVPSLLCHERFNEASLPDFIGFLNESSQTIINTAMLGLLHIQIWFELPAVLILGSKPLTPLASTDPGTTPANQIIALLVF